MHFYAKFLLHKKLVTWITIWQYQQQLEIELSDYLDLTIFGLGLPFFGEIPVSRKQMDAF